MGIVAWIVAGGWRYVAGALAVAAVIGSYAAAFGYGYSSATAKCEAKALQAKLDKVMVERDAAIALQHRAADTAQQLEAANAQAQARARDLQLELDQARDRPAAQDEKRKPNASALVDDHCRLTGAGVRFFTR